jgi:hypothetical protein
LAKSIVDIETIALNSVAFVSALFLVISPRGLFSKYYLVILAFEFSIYGVSYLTSWISPLPKLLSLISVLVGGLGTHLDDPTTWVYW